MNKSYRLHLKYCFFCSITQIQWTSKIFIDAYFYILMKKKTRFFFLFFAAPFIYISLFFFFFKAVSVAQRMPTIAHSSLMWMTWMNFSGLENLMDYIYIVFQKQLMLLLLQIIEQLFNLLNNCLKKNFTKLIFWIYSFSLSNNKNK